MVASDQRNADAHSASAIRVGGRGRHQKKPVEPGEIQIHKRVAEQNHQKIERAQQRRARSAPSGIPRKQQIRHVNAYDRERDDHLGVAEFVAPAQPVFPGEAHADTKRQRDQPNIHAAARHAIQHVQRRKSPEGRAEASRTQHPILDQVDHAEDERKREGRIRPGVQRHVKCEHRAARHRWRGQRTRRENIEQHEPADQQQRHERSHGALAVENFQTQICEAEEPRKERHRAVQIIVRHGVQRQRALIKLPVLRPDPRGKQQRGQPSDPHIGHIQISGVAKKASHIQRQAQVAQKVCHEKRKLPRIACRL